MEDWRGTPIEVGSTVVYATTSGRSPVAKEGKVVSLEAKQMLMWDGTPYLNRDFIKIGIMRVDVTSRGWDDKPYFGEKRVSYPLFNNVTVVSPRVDIT